MNKQVTVQDFIDKFGRFPHLGEWFSFKLDKDPKAKEVVRNLFKYVKKEENKEEF